jgi:hypothetical protein
MAGYLHGPPSPARPFRSRRAISLLTLGALAGGLLLPPVHVHLDPDHDHDHQHPAAVVHQHWGGHEHGHEFSGPEIEHGDDDGHVFYLDEHAIVSTVGGGEQGASASVPIFFLAAALHRDAPIHRVDTTGPPHGPPRRARALRGPPSLSI